MKINGSLRFDASGLSQVENLRVEKLASLPTWGSADVGRLIYVTGTEILWIGGASQWIAMATGGNAVALQTEVDALEVALGEGINTNGTFDVTGFTLGAAGTPTSFTDAINKLAAFSSAAGNFTDLSDVTITSPAQGDVIVLGGTGDWVNRAPGAASGLQPHSIILDGVNNLAAGTGIIVKTGAGSFAARTLTGPAAGLTITDGDGVAGNPTIALANDLAALEGLGTTGYIVRTADGAATTRSIVGTAGNITVSNGNGVGSDTSLNLATVSQASSGNFVKVTVDTFGRVSGTTPVIVSDITSLVNNTYVNVTGDTMTGSLTMSGGATITGIPTPVANTDAANKAYVDSLTNGLSWKNSVRVATQGNINLVTAASGYDGITLIAGDRVLVKNQTAPAENGIYVFNGTGSALTRAVDMDSAAEFDGSAIFVKEGSISGNSGWTETATVVTVGTDPVTFAQFSGSALFTWGTGLVEIGNTVSVNLGAGITELPTDEVGIHLYNAATSAIILTTDGTARSTNAGAALHLLLNGAGGLAQDANGLRISTASVTNAMLVNDGISLDADTGLSSIDLGQTLEIVGNSVQGISTSVTGQTITVTAADATATQKGVASFSNTAFTVAGGVVTLNATLDDLANVSTADSAATDSLLVKGATDWVSVTKADFLNSVTLNDLGDAAVTAAAEGDVLVHNGTNFANRKIYFLYTGAAASTHTVNHNLGQKYCNVTVVDSIDNVVIPESIVYNTTNQLTVTFNTTLACKVVVMGV